MYVLLKWTGLWLSWLIPSTTGTSRTTSYCTVKLSYQVGQEDCLQTSMGNDALLRLSPVCTQELFGKVLCLIVQKRGTWILFQYWIWESGNLLLAWWVDSVFYLQKLPLEKAASPESDPGRHKQDNNSASLGLVVIHFGMNKFRLSSLSQGLVPITALAAVQWWYARIKLLCKSDKSERKAHVLTQRVTACAVKHKAKDNVSSEK